MNASEGLAALKAENERLKAELADERARLDWLDENRVDIEREPDCYEEDDDQDWNWGLTVWEGGMGKSYYGDTLREAIDAAMGGPAS